MSCARFPSLYRWFSCLKDWHGWRNSFIRSESYNLIEHELSSISTGYDEDNWKCKLCLKRGPQGPLYSKVKTLPSTQTRTIWCSGTTTVCASGEIHHHQFQTRWPREALVISRCCLSDCFVPLSCSILKIIFIQRIFQHFIEYVTSLCNSHILSISFRQIRFWDIVAQGIFSNWTVLNKLARMGAYW